MLANGVRPVPPSRHAGGCGGGLASLVNLLGRTVSPEHLTQLTKGEAHWIILVAFFQYWPLMKKTIQLSNLILSILTIENTAQISDIKHKLFHTLTICTKLSTVFVFQT